MTDIDLITLLLIFALSVIFSSFSVERKSSTFSFLSSICWWTLAMVYAGLATASSFISVAYMFMGIGIIFFVYAFVLILTSFLTEKREREWELR